MIIHELFIRGFGRHEMLKIPLESGLNILAGDNESGKSTLMAFVRAMFYGFSRKHASLERDLRRKYRPWHTETMGGSIRFTHEQITYRLERRFGAEKKEDETRLYIDSTGEPVELTDPDRPGLFVLAISEAEFLNTIFAGQRALSVDATAELAGRIFEDTDGPHGADAVGQHLKRARLDLTGKNGKLAAIEAAYTERLNALETARLANQEKAEIAQALAELDGRLTAIDAQLAEHTQQDELERSLDLLYRAAEVAALDAEATIDEASHHGIEITPLGEEITIRTLSDLTDLHQLVIKKVDERKMMRRLQDEKQGEIARLAIDYDDLSDAVVKVNRQVENFQTRRPPKPKKTAKTAFYAGIGGVALGLVLLVIAVAVGASNRISTPLLIAGVLLTIASGVYLFFEYNREQKAIASHRAVLDTLRAERAEISSQLDQLVTLKERVAEQYSAAKRAHDTLTRSIHELEYDLETASAKLQRELSPYCGQIPLEDVGFALNRLRQQMLTPADMARANQYRKLMNDEPAEVFWQRVEAAKAYVREHGIEPDDYRQARERVQKQRGLTLDQEAVAELTAERDALRLERAELSSALSWAGRAVEEETEIMRELQRIEQERDTANALVSAIDKANGWLERAVTEIDMRLAPRLNDLASAYLAAMTDNRYRSVHISRQFDVQVESEDGMLREEAAFSGATVDQIDLSLRLALSTVISEDIGTMPLFLDETLSQLDAKRLQHTFHVLSGESVDQGRQILYLTSDRRVIDTIGERAFVIELPPQNVTEKA